MSYLFYATQQECLISGDFVCGFSTFSLCLFGPQFKSKYFRLTGNCNLPLVEIVSGGGCSLFSVPPPPENPAALSAREAAIQNRWMNDIFSFPVSFIKHGSSTSQRQRSLRKHQNSLCTTYGGVNRSVPDNSSLNEHESWPSLSSLSSLIACWRRCSSTPSRKGFNVQSHIKL